MAVNSTAIEIQHLGFTYPGQSEKSLSNISLSIKSGERFGLFGQNGAGKTTLMSCMTGLLAAQEGHITVFGHSLKNNLKEIKKFIGFVPQDFAFYQELTASENLEFFGAMAGMNRPAVKKKTEELVEILELDDYKQVRQLSGGMKRRVNLAIGVMHQPRILFLDEPTVGVDVLTRQAIMTYLKKLNEDGTTLVYTSHQLSEAEELCETIALMHEGQIIAHDSLTQLLDQHKEKELEGLFISLTGKEYSRENG
ncbi:MAG: ABC transporter ATP-binding protein [bacterium]|nr:ABC transporter ATP-binding protein [bacterium]